MGPKQLYLHTSNRMENLAERLVEVTTNQPLSSTLSQESVMTLNPGIARWLRFEIAKKTGVAFGWDFPLPGKLYKQLLSGITPTFEEDGFFNENEARWRLSEILTRLEDRPRFADLRSYCAVTSPTRRFSLACRLSRLFDEYLVYRPEQIIEWETGDIPGYDWQGELWKRLIRSLYKGNRAPRHLARHWHELSQSDPNTLKPDLSVWPERICVFGVSSLAPLYLDFLDTVSHFRPVHIFLLQPSNLYWADLKSAKEIAKIASRPPNQSEDVERSPEDWIHDSGNPLLPSLGKQGQIFLDLLIDKDPLQDDLCFQEPDTASQLQSLQNDLFNIVDRGASNETDFSNKDPFPKYDASLQFHLCSSRRREIESLWDYLIDRFDRNDDLTGSQILVMAPNIQKYSSHIEAVFGGKRGSPFEIPFSIADRSSQKTSPVLSGLSAILYSPSGRASSKDISAIIESTLIREVFSFSDDDLQTIVYWIQEIGVTWGWDKEHRKQHKSFPTDRNTWAELEYRLSAGLCFAADERLDETLEFSPFTDIESGLSETAGRFLELLELLQNTRRSYHETHSLEDWQTRALALVSRLHCDRDDWSRDYQTATNTIRDALPAIEGLSCTGAEAFQSLLDKLEKEASRSGYLSGGITFCSLKPMRAIPARTICLIGMNNADFPRNPTRLSFDLLSTQFRRGDRNTRDEDRQFFLETLLSVRESLYISYQALSPNSESKKEPSSVVSELQNYLHRFLDQEEYQKFVFTHYRQPFDPAYFQGDRLHTFDPQRSQVRNDFDQARSESNRKPSLAGERPAPERLTQIELEELLRYFKDPARHYIENQVRARVARSSDDLEEMDTLDFEALNKYQFRDELLERIKTGTSLKTLTPKSLAGRKWLPPGFPERTVFNGELEKAAPIAAFYERRLQEQPLQTISIRLSIGSLTLLAQVALHQGSACQTLVFAGKLNPARFLESWIQHLVVCCYTNQVNLPPAETIVLSLDDKSKFHRFHATDQAESILQSLIDHYQNGAATPWPLFPKLSFETYKKWHRSKLTKESEQGPSPAESEALQFAQDEISRAQRPNPNSLYPARFTWTEHDAFCFGDFFELPNDYVALCQNLWGPFTASSEEVKPAQVLSTP